MSFNKVLEVLKNEDKFYFYDNESLASIAGNITPATADEYTHYIYFNKRLSLFFEYSKKENKEIWIDVGRVKEIIEMIVLKQQQVNDFFNRVSTS